MFSSSVYCSSFPHSIVQHKKDMLTSNFFGLISENDSFLGRNLKNNRLNKDDTKLFYQMCD